MPAYNLIDERCLTVRTLDDGGLAEVGLFDALLGAHEIEGLVVDLPTQMPALLRQLMLPVVLDALGAPRDRAEWTRWFAAGRFTEDQRAKLHAYAAAHRDHFDLFHAEAPFAQAAGLRTAKDETKGSALLVATAATGNNVPLYATRTEGDPLALTPAEAMRWLLHTHCWDTAGIKTGADGDDEHVKAGKTTGNQTGPLGQLGVVIPVGRTLYETLLLNLPIGSTTKTGTPQWKKHLTGPKWTIEAAVGLCDLWTWQARRVRLIPEETADGIRVTRVVLAAGDRLRETPEWEPHTAWAYQKAAKGAAGTVRRPRRHTAGKAIWRGMDALLTSESNESSTAKFETSVLLDQLAGLEADSALPADYPLRLETFGIAYGTQSAVIEDVLHDTIPLPVTALHRDSDAYLLLLDVTRQAEELARAVNILSADLRRATGADPIPWDKGQRPGELVLHALDPRVRRLLAGVQDTGGRHDLIEQARIAWEQVAYRATWEIAESVFAVVPAGAFLGREVKQNDKVTVYRPATAEFNFRRQLNQILPRAADSRRDEQSTTAGSATGR